MKEKKKKLVSFYLQKLMKLSEKGKKFTLMLKVMSFLFGDNLGLDASGSVSSHCFRKDKNTP